VEDVDLDQGVVTLTRRIVLGPDGLVEDDVTPRQARRGTLDTSTAAVVADHRVPAGRRAPSRGTIVVCSSALIFAIE